MTETLPASFTSSLLGFADEAAAHRLNDAVVAYLKRISELVDLSTLDGMTIAYDYYAALADLDRGVEGVRPLQATQEPFATGVAMTPSVMRDGQPKSHMVFFAPLLEPLLDPEHPEFRFAVHLLAHEAAHVEVKGILDAAFPGRTLKHRISGFVAGFREQVIEACWEEYGACLLCAWSSDDEVEKGYADTLLKTGCAWRPAARAAVEASFVDNDWERVATEVATACAGVLRYGAYLLGHLHGSNAVLADRPEVCRKLAQLGLLNVLEALEVALQAIANEYGSWKGRASFEVLGDLLESMVGMCGVVMTPTPDGGARVNVWAA